MKISKTTINFAERRGLEVVEQDDGVEFYLPGDEEYLLKVTEKQAYKYPVWVNTEDMPAHVLWNEKHIREVLEYLNNEYSEGGQVA